MRISVLFFLMPAYLWAQPLAEVGHYGENIGTVAVDLDRGVVNEGTRIRAIDLSDPTAPRLGGSIDLGKVPTGAYVVDGTAYVPTNTGQFAVIDVSDVDSPALVAEEDWAAWKYGVYVRRVKDFAYVGTCSTVEIIDISEPVDPVRVGNLGNLGACVEAVTGDGGYLYVLTRGGGDRIRTYSLADPRFPALMSIESAVSSSFSGVATFGDAMYISESQGRIYDIADRTDPRLVEEFGGGDGTYDIDGGMLYVGKWGRLQVWNLTGPTAPTLDTDLLSGPNDQVWQLAAFEGHSLAARIHALTYVDTAMGSTSDLHSPTPNVGRALCGAIAGDLLYMSTGPGLAVLSVADPQNPELLNHQATRWTVDMKVLDDYLYNLTSWGYLEVYSLETPESPVMIAEYPMPTDLQSKIAVTANNVAAAGRNEVRFFERMANGSLAQSSVRGLPTNGNGVALLENTAYVALSNGDLQVWSLGDLSNPTLLATLRILTNPLVGSPVRMDAEVSGDRLHLLFGGRGYALVDITDPTAPEVLGRLQEGDTEGGNVEPVGDTVYVAANGWNGRRGVRALDVTDPSNIFVSATADATGRVLDVVFGNGHVFTFEVAGCLRVRTPVSAAALGSDTFIVR